MIIDRIFYTDYMNSKFDHRLSKGVDYTKLEPKALKKILSEFYNLSAKYGIYNENLISTFIYDLTIALSECDFTEAQFKRMDLWMQGYNEREIAEKEGITRWVASKSIRACCEKLVQKMIEDSK